MLGGARHHVNQLVGRHVFYDAVVCVSVLSVVEPAQGESSRAWSRPVVRLSAIDTVELKYLRSLMNRTSSLDKSFSRVGEARAGVCQLRSMNQSGREPSYVFHGHVSGGREQQNFIREG